MKKSFLSLSAALLLGGATQTLSTPARAAETRVQRAGRAALAAAYKKQSAAMVRGDADTVFSFMAPDYQLYGENGNVTDRARNEAAMRMVLSGSIFGVPTRFTKYEPKILSLTWRGKDAIVMVQTTAVSVASQNGRSARSETVSLTRDYWTPTPQGWKIRQSAERLNKVWLNGERVH